VILPLPPETEPKDPDTRTKTPDPTLTVDISTDFSLIAL
jgi:hypothetical protein